LFGSHIDSVPGGGDFDGDLGSMAAIEVIHTLKDHNVTTRQPLQVVIWQNEEGGLVGSRTALGVSLDLARQYNGIRFADGLRKIGGDPAKLEQSRIAPGSFHCLP
jgi:N-carbamoyl-L-amino-acid hydrolase